MEPMPPPSTLSVEEIVLALRTLNPNRYTAPDPSEIAKAPRWIQSLAEAADPDRAEAERPVNKCDP